MPGILSSWYRSRKLFRPCTRSSSQRGCRCILALPPSPSKQPLADTNVYAMSPSLSPIRERLLDAAARVYAETGYRGATTRRIAQEAGVNEITLFRHFGSKTTLILEAVRQANLRTDCPVVPTSPGEPVAEIRGWVRDQLAHLTRLRSIIRTSLGEVEERPEIIPLIGE